MRWKTPFTLSVVVLLALRNTMVRDVMAAALLMKIILLVLLLSVSAVAHGQDIFVANSGNNGTIGEYDATSGAVVNASLVSGLSYPWGIAVLVVGVPGLISVVWRPTRGHKVLPASVFKWTVVLAMTLWLPAHMHADTICCYRFETNNGQPVSNGQLITAADDSSGNGLNGVVRGSPTYATSPFGPVVPATNAPNNFAFFGDPSENNGIEIDPVGTPLLQSTFTVETDFRFTSDDPNTGDVKRIFHCQGVQIGSPSPLSIYLANLYGSPGTDDLECSFDGEAFALRASHLDVNTNYDLALTYDGTTASLYLNGSLIQTGAYTGFGGSGSAIGAIGNTQYFDRRTFPGYIDEVRISNVALQPDQFLSAVPEPSTLALLVAAAIGLLGNAWRRRAARRAAKPTFFNESETRENGPAILSMSSRWTEAARRAA